MDNGMTCFNLHIERWSVIMYIYSYIQFSGQLLQRWCWLFTLSNIFFTLYWCTGATYFWYSYTYDHGTYCTIFIICCFSQSSFIFLLYIYIYMCLCDPQQRQNDSEYMCKHVIKFHRFFYLSACFYILSTMQNMSW